LHEAHSLPGQAVTSRLLEPSHAALSKLAAARDIPSSIPRNFRADYKATSASPREKFRAATRLDIQRTRVKNRRPGVSFPVSGWRAATRAALAIFLALFTVGFFLQPQ
jgi:hypothetical protein